MAQQLLEILEIMSPRGHDKKEYDPNNKKQVKEIKDFIQAKIKEGWNLYAEMTDGSLELIRSIDDIDDSRIERIMLSQGAKRLLASPNVGG